MFDVCAVIPGVYIEVMFWHDQKGRGEGCLVERIYPPMTETETMSGGGVFNKLFKGVRYRSYWVFANQYWKYFW